MKSLPNFQVITKFFCIPICCWLIPICGSAFAQVIYKNDPTQMARLKPFLVRVEQNPDNLKAHEDFIRTLDEGDPHPFLRHEYSVWLKRFPKSATVNFALGRSLVSRNIPEGKDFPLKAVNLNPNLAEACDFVGHVIRSFPTSNPL